MTQWRCDVTKFPCSKYKSLHIFKMNDFKAFEADQDILRTIEHGIHCPSIIKIVISRT